MSDGSTWDRWDALRTSSDPDPMEVLEAIASFQRYFKAIEREAMQAARAQGRTWNDIGNALGKSRQAAWQTGKAAEMERLVREGRSRHAEVCFRIGLEPF